jgi:hypothetical protein
LTVNRHGSTTSIAILTSPVAAPLTSATPIDWLAGATVVGVKATGPLAAPDIEADPMVTGTAMSP